jgi:hypothetical protein
MNLEELFRKNLERGVIDFALRVSSTPGEPVRFYIHPASVFGDTLDFEVSKNTLVPAGWAKPNPS